MISWREPLATGQGVTNSYVMTVPSWVQNGDLMVMVVTARTGTGGPTPPAGWSTASVFNNGGVGFQVGVFYRTASSEPGTYTVTATGSPFIAGFIGCAFDTSGATVAYDTIVTSTAVSGTTASLPAITPASGNVDPLAAILGVAICGQGAAAVCFNTPMGILYQTLTEQTSAGTLAAIVYPQARNVASPTPTATTLSAGTWCLFQLALKITGSASTDRIAVAGYCSNHTDGGATSLSVNVPSNVANNDQIIVMAFADGDSIAQTSFTQVDSADSSKWVLFRRTASSEPSSYTFTCSSSTHIRLALIVLRHMDGLAMVIDTDAMNGPSGTVTSFATPTITTSTAHETVLCGWITKNTAGLTSPLPPTGAADGWVGFNTATTGGGFVSDRIYVSAFTQASASLTTARTWSASSTDTWDALQVAIKTVAVNPPPPRTFTDLPPLAAVVVDDFVPRLYQRVGALIVPPLRIIIEPPDDFRPAALPPLDEYLVQRFLHGEGAGIQAPILRLLKHLDEDLRPGPAREDEVRRALPFFHTTRAPGNTWVQGIQLSTSENYFSGLLRNLVANIKLSDAIKDNVLVLTLLTRLLFDDDETDNFNLLSYLQQIVFGSTFSIPSHHTVSLKGALKLAALFTLTSDPIFPTAPGLAWPVLKTPATMTGIATSISGLESRTSPWSYSAWRFGLRFNFLQTTDFLTYQAFFISRQGRAQTFVFDDITDDAVSNMTWFTVPENFVNFGAGGIPPGTPVQLSRQLTTSGGVVYQEPVYAPKPGLTFQINGSPQTATYGPTGLVTFPVTLNPRDVVTWSGGFYWRVRFLQDMSELEQFLSQLWELKTIEFETVKA